jgi:HK97 family phage prohead protease
MTNFTRAFPLEDISIKPGGDGRTVIAYAAVWDQPTEIHDHQGHYREQLSRTSFARTLSHRGDRPYPVLFNHGRTIYGTPSELDSLPIGVSVEPPRIEDRGLLTVSRYHEGDRAEQVLEAIKSGSIRAQSFSGSFVAQDRKVPRGGFRPDASGELPLVTRTEIALREYGPATFEAYPGAEILGVRAALAELSDEQIERLLALATPLDPAERADTSDPEPVESVADPLTQHAARLTRSISARRALRSLLEGQ